MTTKICPRCEKNFSPGRKDQRYCTSACRKAANQKSKREGVPANSTNSPSKRRENLEIVDKAIRLSEHYYSIIPADRDRFMGDLLALAAERVSGTAKLREVLSSKYLRDSENSKHYFRRCPYGYPNITQVADEYCKHHFGCKASTYLSSEASSPEVV